MIEHVGYPEDIKNTSYINEKYKEVKFEETLKHNICCYETSGLKRL